MVVINQKTFKVKNYQGAYNWYLEGKFGVLQQRMPENLIRQTKKNGTNLERIISLLSKDNDNVYHVTKRENNKGYLITLLGFSITKEIPTNIETYQISFGEDGKWELGWGKEINGSTDASDCSFNFDGENNFPKEHKSTLLIHDSVGSLLPETKKSEWHYSCSTDTIWTSFDCGEVEAETYDEAVKLATDLITSRLFEINTKLCDEVIYIDLSQLEVTKLNKTI